MIIIIFSKILSNNNEVTEISAEQEDKKEPPFTFPNEEIPIYKQIKEFREDPKKFLDKKDLEKLRKQKEYENFINSLEKFPELTPDKELYELAKSEVQKFEDNSEYQKYQIGEEFKENLSENLSKKHIGLIGIEEIEKIELLIPSIIINDSDSQKKGRTLLTNPELTHIGISQLKTSEGTFIIIIISKLNDSQKNEKESILSDNIEEEKPSSKEKVIVLSNEKFQYMNKSKNLEKILKNF